MSSSRSTAILQQPFHPLDLSHHDLLTIYRRFEESRLINRNPKHELPIEVVVQMVSSLKQCPPSYVQKCMSQALIRPMISWNDFLSFLDQESEVRERLLSWLMHERSEVRYRLAAQLPFRSNIRQYEQITFLKFVDISHTEKFIICCLDQTRIVLIDVADAKFTVIGEYVKKTERRHLEIHEGMARDGMAMGGNNKNAGERTFIKSESKRLRGERIRRVHSKSERDRPDNTRQGATEQMTQSLLFASTVDKQPIGTLTRSQEQTLDDQAYFRKQRRNINLMFNVFRDLPLEQSICFSKMVAQKLQEKTLNSTITAKEGFTQCLQKPSQPRKITLSVVRPLDRARSKLKSLYEQKNTLSYNPYSIERLCHSPLLQNEISRPKRVLQSKQLKEKAYSLRSICSSYSEGLQCLATVYYNLQLVLVKIVKEYNKISFQEQDSLRVLGQRDHKRNEIVEGIEFYRHGIVSKWYMLVLVRVQSKQQYNHCNESYLLVYEIELRNNKRRGELEYRFAARKEVCTLQLGKHEMVAMEVQGGYGLHFISVKGRYLCWREDYVESVAGQMSFFKLGHEEKFRGTGLSLCCLSVSLSESLIMFGTVKGIIAVYEMFSHKFRLKKIGSQQIVQVAIVKGIGYALTIDYRLLIYDLAQLEEIQSLSVRNEEKLHERISRFEFHHQQLCLFGTEARLYEQYVEEAVHHEHRKMQNMYTWRADKLIHSNQLKISHSVLNNTKHNEPQKGFTGSLASAVSRSSSATVSPFVQQVNLSQPISFQRTSEPQRVEMAISSASYFIVLLEQLRIVLLHKGSRKRQTMVLDVAYDAKVLKMHLSHDEKLLALLLFTQQVHIFNIHTQDLYALIKPTPSLRFVSLVFLDSRNEYFLALGTENGKIVLQKHPPAADKLHKVLNHHHKAITFLCLFKTETMVSCCENGVIAVWTLPFNVLRHELTLSMQMGWVVEQVGCSRSQMLLRITNGNILELSLGQGKIIRQILVSSNWSFCAYDSRQQLVVGINTEELEIYEKTENDSSGWRRRASVKIDRAQETIYVGVVQSQCVVVFLEGGHIVRWNFWENRAMKVDSISLQ